MRCCSFHSIPNKCPPLNTHAQIAYTYDDVSGDTSLSYFDITKTPSNVFSVINDIRGVNPYLKIHLLPWSPVSTLLYIVCLIV